MTATMRADRVKIRGPLQKHAEGFEAELLRLGFTPASMVNQFHLLAHLSLDGDEGLHRSPAGFDAPVFGAEVCCLGAGDRHGRGAQCAFEVAVPGSGFG